LKASPVDVVRRRLPEEIAEQVVGVVGYMESPNGKECVYVKGNIERMYRLLMRI